MRPKIKIEFLLVEVLLFLAVVACSSQPALVSSPLTVPQIVALSQEGVPPEEIIDRIRKSRVVYRLLPNQIENMRRKGVSNQVLSYIQKRYQAALEKYPYLRDWDNWNLYDGYWYASPGDDGSSMWLE